MIVSAKSDMGLIRTTNEDTYECRPPHLFIVADGMGGHLAGEVASRMAVDIIMETLDSQTIGDANYCGVMSEAIAKANETIYNQSRRRQECAGMGTTVSLAYIAGARCYWSHVGDSRIYLLRGDELVQITQDHSLVCDLVASGTISLQEAAVHPQRNVLTRAVGVEDTVKADAGFVDIQIGDHLLMCSDGLSNMIDDDTIKSTITENDDVDAAVTCLLNRANDAGGIDNITAILIRI